MNKAFFSKLIQTIESRSLIANEDRILLGLSGGTDSSCLFYALLHLKKKYHFELTAVHLNYGVRKSAAEDEKFCSKICRQEKTGLFKYQVLKNSLRFFSFGEKNGKSKPVRIKVPHNLLKVPNFENRARKIRYYLFEKIAQKNNFSKIAIAHNANDQAETVLINFLRGSGLKGIGGMNYRRGKIIRPLLDITRKEILHFMKRNGFKFRTDETNFDAGFTRNRIRYQLLKEIEKNYNPNIVVTLARNSALYREAEESIEKTGRTCLEKALLRKNSQSLALNWKKIKTEPPVIVGAVLRMIILDLRGDLNDISQELIKKTIGYLNNPRNKKKFSEIGKLTIKKNGDKVIFERL